MARLDAFLQLGREQGCSDIHFTVGLPPLARLDGDLVPLKYRDLSADETEALIREIMGDDHKAQFEERGATDFSYSSEEVGRFRVNVCRHSNGVAAICRVVPDRPPRLADLGETTVARHERSSDHTSPPSAAAAREQATTLEAALLQLSERYREVVYHRMVLDLPWAEVAAAMELKNGESARALHHKATARLAALLGRSGPDDHR